jgi:uncharacterized membrane protein
MSTQLEHAKRPISPLAGPYGHPLHPIFVTIPIGAWVSSLVLDIASHIVGRPDVLAQASQWLIAIGVIGALLAAMFGLLDLFAIPRGTPAFRTGLLHMALNSSVAAAFIANFFWRYPDYPQQGAVGIGPLVLSIVSITALVVSGFLGGMLSYRYGVRVVTETAQADGYRSANAGAGIPSPEKGRG